MRFAPAASPARGPLAVLWTLALGAATLLAACVGPPEEPPMMRLTASAPRTYYVTTERGRTLFFQTAVHNRTDTTQALYLFAYAADNTAQPPARAVYPPRALASMPRDRRFAMGRPNVGLPVTIAPGDSAEFRGALPLPTEWPDGQRIESEAFRDFYLYAYTQAGRSAYHQKWLLLRVKGDTR